jgi:hypothetical protein
MSERVDTRCSDLSRAAGEPLAGTAVHVDRWLLVEVPGRWPRDVGAGGGLPADAEAAVARWAADRSERRRIMFVRRPGELSGSHRVFVVHATERATDVRRLELERLEQLVEVDLDGAGTRVDTPLVLVCGHGSRDGCCALRGTAVYGVLETRLGAEELWISSHQGGHRFAANVLALPSGIQLGRVNTDEAPELVDRALGGRISLDRYRGRTCYAPPVQAAEHAVRDAHRLDAVDDLELAGVDGPVVRFCARDGRELAARVVERAGPVVPASCGAAPEAQRVLAAQPE